MFKGFDWPAAYLRAFNQSMIGRNLYFTHDRIPGLCSKASQIGDLIVLLLSCKTLLVLRPQDNDTHLLVGDAYQYGSMNSDALLGPLPPRYRPVLSEPWYPVFRDEETQEILLDDPRLGDLPAGWTASETILKGMLVFENGSTGERRTAIDFDPRMTKEELEKRGVELQEFALA